MDQIKKLNGVRLDLGDIILRPWQEGDEASLAKYANNRSIWQNVRDRFPHPYTHQDARIWVQVADKDPNALNFAIEVDKEAVGGIGVVFKDDVYHRTAEIGYWLGEPYWKQGITTRAVSAVTDYVFAHYDICRLYAGIFEYNTASGRVLEKAGYTLEARLRKNVTKNGRTVDELVYAKIKD
uniref:GNAT family protein n=1 Tax=Roseihalotalea indica TaxID=2867963 RepID=A0AA49GIC6_9BACT|nr:GNAT family protein [Tunicatimonas sp. TK19036]